MSFQGGDNDISAEFYKLVFPYIHTDDTILNMGCGFRFVFEENLSKVKKTHITSIDILPVSEKPPYIDEFKNQSVEEEFSLDKKFDAVTFFELIEHIDKTDILLKNCYNNLRKNGLLIFSFPNLASVYSRIELLLGYQPHILETSNEYSNFGTGFFGQKNNPKGEPIHHIRGISYQAMKEMVQHYGFSVIKTIGYDHHRLRSFFMKFPSVAPVNIFVCRKLK